MAAIVFRIYILVLYCGVVTYQSVLSGFIQSVRKGKWPGSEFSECLVSAGLSQVEISPCLTADRRVTSFKLVF